jgi:hypothetical protein
VTSRFGSSVNDPDDIARLSRMMGRPLTSVRVYYETPPAKWPTSGAVLGSLPSNGTVSISFRHGTPAQVRTFLAGHPRTVTCYATYYHEPEFGFQTATERARFRTTFASYAPAIRAAGCIPMLIVFCWLMHDKTRDWHDWYPRGSVDALGFDAYNLVGPQGRYATPAEFLAPFIAASRETSLPWAMPEVGSFIGSAGLTAAGRAAWANDVARAAAADPKFRFADWWDGSSADPTKNFRMDSSLARAWHF